MCSVDTLYCPYSQTSLLSPRGGLRPRLGGLAHTCRYSHCVCSQLAGTGAASRLAGSSDMVEVGRSCGRNQALPSQEGHVEQDFGGKSADSNRRLSLFPSCQAICWVGNTGFQERLFRNHLFAAYSALSQKEL